LAQPHLAALINTFSVEEKSLKSVNVIYVSLIEIHAKTLYLTEYWCGSILDIFGRGGKYEKNPDSTSANH
jgi:hypothetical protein